MNRLIYCSCILLLSFQTPAMASGFKKILALAYGLSNRSNQEDFGETIIIRTNPDLVYLPKESVLKHCLNKSGELQSRDYHPAIIEATAHFLALQKGSPAAIERATTNTVMSTLGQQALAHQQPLLLDDLGNSTILLTPNLTRAVISCQTTKARYRLQKSLARTSRPVKTDYWRN